MIGRLALRSLTAHPVRSAVLAAGFGVGVAVMAILLGVAAIVLEQAQSPALTGGGDVVVYMSERTPARLLLSGTLQAESLRERIRVLSPQHTDSLFLTYNGRTTTVAARGGVPSLERELGDPETASVAVWQDTPADREWKATTPSQALRQIDRFHPVPDVPRWAGSWAEWLYFNGRTSGARFYLTFLVGPVSRPGMRSAGVRLQLERNGRMSTFTGGAEISDAAAMAAPDLTIGTNAVHLDGLRYHLRLDLAGRDGGRVRGELTLDAAPGALIPPLEIAGARGWRTGYVVPVMSGTLGGSLDVDGETVSFDNGVGYHDHNWGFWEGVSWQWGQAQHEDLSFIYGRVFPPREAADPERMPGFIGVLGPDGPLGYSDDVKVNEVNGPDGRPTRIAVTAQGPGLDIDMQFAVASTETSRTTQAPVGNGVDLLQMRGSYAVNGRAGNRTLAFTAPGSAETFRSPTVQP